MANQSEGFVEWQRLHELYQGMQDEELMELAGQKDDLTDVARDVLIRELKVRGLPLEAPVAVAEPEVAASRSSFVRVSKVPTRGTVELMTFYDALYAGRACQFLDEQDLPLEVIDLSSPQTGVANGDNGSAVALRMMVQEADRERAKAILREKMALFPLQEVLVADERVDDGTLAVLGTFGRREEADEVGSLLVEARVWHKVTTDPDGSEEDENLYAIEVKEIDLERAVEVVERSLDLSEG